MAPGELGVVHCVGHRELVAHPSSEGRHVHHPGCDATQRERSLRAEGERNHLRAYEV